MNPRRLYRCRQDRLIAGVAGGLAEYLEVDPTIVRILWIGSVFLGGFTLLLYVIMVFIVPLEPWAPPAGYAPPVPTGDAGDPPAAPGEPATAAGQAGPLPYHHHAVANQGRRPGWNASLVFGVLFLVFGAIALVGEAFPGSVTGARLGPAFLVALGVALLVGAMRRPAADG